MLICSTKGSIESVHASIGSARLGRSNFRYDMDLSKQSIEVTTERSIRLEHKDLMQKSFQRLIMRSLV